jgi:hypothetical protein
LAVSTIPGGVSFFKYYGKAFVILTAKGGSLAKELESFQLLTRDTCSVFR